MDFETDGADKAQIESPEEGEFFAALARKQAANASRKAELEQKKAEMQALLNTPEWREISRIAAVVRSAGDSSTAIAMALYERGCRLPAPEGEPEGPAAA